jgi:alkanesulfonate monooxygenase SsuD/methylene tetrahydromethanopterin reductase-like flavin-dependent oxidoreductase (luciferase family)
MNGNTLEGFQEQIADVRARAKKLGREDDIKFAVNGFCIVKETEEEAIRLLQEIQGKADKDAVLSAMQSNKLVLALATRRVCGQTASLKI